MPSTFYFRLAAFFLAVILCVAAFLAWRADRRDRAQLATELASTKQLLAAADARQHDRDAQLSQTLAALAGKKRTINTPDQILRELPSVLPLPTPVTPQTPSATPESPAAPVAQAFRPEAFPPSPSVTQAGKPGLEGSVPAPQKAILPAEDLKPLYDFALDCQACQAKLSATQNDLVDERQKTAALTKDRDAALRLAKGGSPWRRVARAAKWFLLGAAAGAVLSKAH